MAITNILFYGYKQNKNSMNNQCLQILFWLCGPNKKYLSYSNIYNYINKILIK